MFLWAKNQTNADHLTSDSFDIIDTQGNRTTRSRSTHGQPVRVDSAHA